jgi:hypothetical protein
LLGYPRFYGANAIKPLAWLCRRPYGLACWESGLCDSDLVYLPNQLRVAHRYRNSMTG